DPEAATCAHRTLPFGAELLVTMPGSGVVVQCRVNDRGPFVPGRVLDVSRAVAEQLGIIQAGVAPAHVHRLGPEPPGNDPVAPGS
ncbi:MAG: septal ring lytic transglycosylase RlpA family protein, partial [Myxococcota bacterium]